MEPLHWYVQPQAPAHEEIAEPRIQITVEETPRPDPVVSIRRTSGGLYSSVARCHEKSEAALPHGGNFRSS